MGSPSVAGSMMLRRSSISVASRLDGCRRPPPLRRSRPFGSDAASRSFRPRPMVERANPVIAETAARPPHPAAPDLAGREHPPPALIKLRADRLPSLPNGLRVDHADPHTAVLPLQESRRPEFKSPHGAQAKYDSFVVTAVLIKKRSASFRQNARSPAPARTKWAHLPAGQHHETVHDGSVDVSEARQTILDFSCNKLPSFLAAYRPIMTFPPPMRPVQGAAGISTLNEGQRVEFDVVSSCGKSSAKIVQAWMSLFISRL